MTAVERQRESNGRAELLQRELLDSLFVLAAVFARDGRVLETNERALTAFGLTREHTLGVGFTQIAERVLASESIADATRLLQQAAAGQTARGELIARFAGGQLAVVDCTFRPVADSTGQVTRITVTGIEVTSHKRAELALAKLNRELRLVSGCNRLLVREDDERSLLQNLCRIIVEEGGYRLAWVGFAQSDAECSVRPMAMAGRDAHYVMDSRITWADTPPGAGPTGRAIRNRRVEVCPDIEQDPLFTPWRQAARERGFRATIALPLIIDHECIGALNICSDQAESFDAPEIQLLSEVARDLSYGIEALRTRAARNRAQQQIELFRALLQETNDMVYVVDAETGRVIDVNESGARRLGYTRRELLELKVSDFSLAAAERPWRERTDYLRQAGALVTEGLYRAKDGRTFPVEFSLRYLEHDGKGYVIGITRDITERRRQHEQIERLARILRMQSGINSAVLRIQGQDELLQEACRLAAEVGGYDRAVFSVVEPDGKYAVPRFRAGAGADFPEPERLEIGELDGLDRNLSARALRTGAIAVNADLSCPEPPVAMRETLVKLGYKAMVALPLIVEGRRVAVLVLTARDPQLAADNDLLILLQDMMASLSFALQSKENAAAAQYLAYFDPMTGLAKRALFQQRLDELLQRELGPTGELAVIAFDVRSLNRINDTYGRHFGDQVLQKIAERLKGYARSDAHIGHLGGGTFAILEPPLSSGDESIRSLMDANLFGEPVQIEGQSLRLSCSYGVAHYPRDATEAGALLQRAEAALKHAKESGERYLHYRLEMHSQMTESLELEHKLSAAIVAGQFELYYQPQVHLKSGRVEAAEALLRWNDPASGIVPPQKFLDVLESTGMILTVGEWVLNRAVEDCERWFAMGLAPLRVAVNVSAMQLRQRTFVRQVLACCDRLARCGRFGLDLEITETTWLQDMEGTSAKLRELRAAGVRIALDDFGTGYSSLGLLSRLPVDLLKIDRSFTKGLPEDPSSVVLVETILRLASSFKLTTVVEGVETMAQLEALRAMPCHFWQGYLYSAPVPAKQLESQRMRA